MTHLKVICHLIKDYTGTIAFFSLLFQVQILRANWPGPVEISFWNNPSGIY